MSKYGKRILAAGMCASMAMGLLTGCSSSNDEVVAKMGDTKLTLGEANFMLRYSQAQTQSCQNTQKSFLHRNPSVMKVI